MKSNGDRFTSSPQYLDKVVVSAITQYPIDLTRVYTVGYSAGCRGTVRYNVFRPYVC